MWMHIDVEETTSPGMVIDVNVPTNNTGLPDADMLALAQVIFASDTIQNAPQWNAAPSLASVWVDTTRTLYPTE